MSGRDNEVRVTLGRITGLFGVRGWVKVFSHTEPRDNIVNYATWYLSRGGDWVEYRVEAGRRQGKGVIAKLVGVDDRDAAAALLDTEIAVARSQMPALQPDEYYWTDLQGLSVVTIQGEDLGRVDHLFATGANDVLVVQGERERLIPFVQPDVVHRVDLANGRIEVDWDPEF